MIITRPNIKVQVQVICGGAGEDDCSKEGFTSTLKKKSFFSSPFKNLFYPFFIEMISSLFCKKYDVIILTWQMSKINELENIFILIC